MIKFFETVKSDCFNIFYIHHLGRNENNKKHSELESHSKASEVSKGLHFILAYSIHIALVVSS